MRERVARSALRYAVGLARAFSAEIDLLHVTSPPHKIELVADAYLGLPMPTANEQAIAEARTHLGQLMAIVPHDGVQVTALVEAGDPAATIVRMATELPSDLVVLGTHARTGISEMVRGSVAHQVATCAPCPVVTLRGDELNARVSI